MRPLLALGALTLAAALLVACDGGDEDRATPSSTVEVTATESATTTSAPARTPAAREDIVTSTPPELPSHAAVVDARITGYANGFIAIDPTDGTVSTIWAGNERLWDIDVYPSLAERGDGVWLSWDNGSIESVRFDPEGNEVDRVPGLWAQESADGTIVTYYTDFGGPGRHYMARYPDHTADLGVGCCGRIARDGRIAFLGPFEDGVQSLLIYQPSSRETWVAAEGIGRPGKDGVIYPTWTPSERFVLDFSIDQANPTESRGILVDTATRETLDWDREQITWWMAGPAGEDWIGRLADGDLVFSSLLDEAERLRLSAPDTEFTGMVALDRAIAAYAETPQGMTTILYGLDGAEINRWVGEFWYVTETQSGYAAIEVGYQNGSWACPSSVIDHPNFQGEVGCVGTSGQWSPGGRFYASRLERKTGDSIYIFDTRAGEGRIYEVGRSGVGIQWSADGSSLVVRLGGGM